jgi:hypothetical protein
MSGTAAAEGGGGTTGKSTYRNRHLSQQGDTGHASDLRRGPRQAGRCAGEAGVDDEMRDEHGRTLEEWLQHAIDTGERPQLRDVGKSATSPAPANVSRVATMLLAGSSQLPHCELEPPAQNAVTGRCSS